MVQNSAFRRMISVDPGLTFGWAAWQDREVQLTGQSNTTIGDWHLLETGIFETSPKDEFAIRLFQIGREFARVVARHQGCEMVYIEEPFFDEKNTAVNKSGALVKLSASVGALLGAITEQRIRVETVPVRKWKGQLPKEITHKRIQLELPNCKATSHALDAVGIGLYKVGRF